MNRSIKILALLVLLDIVGVGILWYGYTYVSKQKLAETELLDQLRDEKVKNQKLAAISKTLSSVEMQRHELDQFLIESSDENQIQLITALEKLGATTTGAIVDTSRFEPSAGAVPMLHGDLSITGSWSQVYHFLRLMEEYPSRLIIGRFEVHRDESQTVSQGKPVGEKWAGAISIDFASLKPEQN